MQLTYYSIPNILFLQGLIPSEVFSILPVYERVRGQEFDFKNVVLSCLIAFQQLVPSISSASQSHFDFYLLDYYLSNPVYASLANLTSFISTYISKSLMTYGREENPRLSSVIRHLMPLSYLI